ncbi:Fanconi anemia group G protein isoform X2 [Pantherophis guttatus]|uniref:Fanconi anemia group G protein isoform X2 n=1 Tax=Pantherophis guttatus TaxID=94885 RepID=A0A6P9DZB6_PANGU|nr:Fanconi anemia group G protein isoform X2 [Pantherophis guttatus]
MRPSVCEMAGDGDGCLALWRAENDRLARRWRRAARLPGPDPAPFAELLRKIQGLPAALPSLPLELAVLCNALPAEMSPPGGCPRRASTWIERGLRRVLEACAATEEGLDSGDLWPRVLHQSSPEELRAPLHHLAALQAASWLADHQLERARKLLRLLSGDQIPDPPCVGCDSEVLSLLQVWHPHEMGESDPLVVQTIRDLKEILWTSAAFLQGVQELEADNPHGALPFLQAAVSGLCSKRVLAQIFTLMGSCYWKVGKPHTALQHLKQALEMDSTFLPALYQAALLYHQLGLTEAELEALLLLCQALESPPQVTLESHESHFLIRTELLTSGCRPAAFLAPSCPSGVKYMLAKRCLQAERATEAAEHYLDLLALFQEGPLPQVSQCSEPAVPRISEVFLEAASALEEATRHQEAVVVCEEVVSHTSRLIPAKLCIVLDLSSEKEAVGAERSSLAKSPAAVLEEQRESLRCVLWQAAAHLIQGWARARLGEPKEAINSFSRCLNDLLRVHLVSTGRCKTEPEREQTAIPEAELLPQIRLLALTGRGIRFLELGRLKEALMDFQFSLQVSPDSCTSTLYLLHTLWKLDRKQEVVAHWPKLPSEPGLMEENTGRSFPLYLRSCVKQMEFPHRESFAKDIKSYLGENSQVL